jgi:hypothetical protein
MFARHLLPHKQEDILWNVEIARTVEITVRVIAPALERRLHFEVPRVLPPRRLLNPHYHVPRYAFRRCKGKLLMRVIRPIHPPCLHPKVAGIVSLCFLSDNNVHPIWHSLRARLLERAIALVLLLLMASPPHIVPCVLASRFRSNHPEYLLGNICWATLRQ